MSAEFYEIIRSFFEKSELPQAFWRRLLERTEASSSGIVSIPGRIVFFDQTHDDSQDEDAGDSKFPVRVFVRRESLVVYEAARGPIEISHEDFLPSHEMFVELLAPPNRSFQAQASKKLSELAAQLMNRLALVEPARATQPKDWLHVVLNLIRLGAANTFLGATVLRSGSQTLPIEQINKLVEALPESFTSNGSSGLPHWCNSECVELANRIISADYTGLSGSALAAYLHKIGASGGESGLWGHFAEGDSVRQALEPLIDHISVSLSSLDMNSNLTFIDPTDSPGSFLSELIVSLSSPYGGEKPPEAIHPSRFVALISNEQLAWINRLCLWFTHCKCRSENDAEINVEQSEELWAAIPVRVIDQMTENWVTQANLKSGSIPVIVGAPKFAGTNQQTDREKEHVERIFQTKKVDLSACWLQKAAEIVANHKGIASLTLTNSVTQGEQVATIWPRILSDSVQIGFARQAFRWAGRSGGNQSTGVTVVVIGLTPSSSKSAAIFSDLGRSEVAVIGPYLVPGVTEIVKSQTRQLSGLPKMVKGNMPFAKSLILNQAEYESLVGRDPGAGKFIRKLVGSDELVNSSHRYCLWITSPDSWKEAKQHPEISSRVDESRVYRQSSTNEKLALTPWRFRETFETVSSSLVVPSVTSETRRYIPIGFIGPSTIVSNLAFVVYESPDWLFPLLTSSIHMTWLRLVSGGLETRIRYSNRLSYNTFPFPGASSTQKQHLVELGRKIIDSRADHPELSLARLYSDVPFGLKRAHDETDAFVGELYGIRNSTDERDVRSGLMEMYSKGVSGHAN